ncbi:MAG TPA: hypothetical protein DEP84_21330 [Chloroflexi bacterium]|nr:hypothetical protein [Chloroflexota bacterium]
MASRNQRHRARKRKNRVIVVGLDGVPYTYIQKLFRLGELPNFRAIVDGGALVQMDTTLPNASPVAWSSFMTGKNPGKHSIYGFVDREPGSLRTFMPSPRTLHAPVLGELMATAGKRVFVMSVPLTFPPRQASGMLVGCFLGTNRHKAASNAEAGESPWGLNPCIDADPRPSRQDKDNFLLDLDEVFEWRVAAMRYLWCQEPWDLFVAHIMETDWLHHFFWKEMEQGDARYVPTFLEFYRRIDQVFGEVRAWLDEETTLIVLSNHGFCTIKQEVYINTWLHRAGYLQYSREQPEGLHDMAPSSTAYSLDSGRIFLNVRGREPRGRIARAAEYERVRREIAEAAMTMADPVTGEPMVRRVYMREELYHGPYAHAAPDLVLAMHDGYDPKELFGKQELTFKGDARVGMHTTPDALLYIRGLHHIDRRPSITDVAPTILDHLGVPVPHDMDGCSLLRESECNVKKTF